MIGLLIHVRRLHRANPSLFLAQLLNPLAHQKLSSCCTDTSPSHHSIGAFQQTLINPGHSSLQSLHSSASRSSDQRHIYDVINFRECVKETRENAQVGLSELTELIQKAKNFDSGDEALDFLDKGGVKPNKYLIFSSMFALRKEWKLAFLLYKWGERWDCVDEMVRCLMIWVLGNHTKFGTAWSLIHDLHKNSVDTKEALLIMIDRYAATNQFDKAVKTFETMEKFCLLPDQDAFFTFLNILCKHGNIEEAEEFMFLNKKFFPLVTEGFNIILNGWCNIAVDIVEAKRVWREMSKCCILPNGMSYTHLISCFAKVRNLFDSLRLCDEMKKRGFQPGIEVYNSLAYVLASEDCLKESLTILNKMKEAGLYPDSTTYNNIIIPLCGDMKLEEARMVLAMMIEDNVSPTIDTYHAFLTGASLEGAFEVLNHMRKAGLGPNGNTFLQILGKFFELKQPESALKVWLEMRHYEILPDLAHYRVLVEGLAKCGLLVKAREFYNERRSRGFARDPKLEKLFKEPRKDRHLEGDRRRTIKHIEEGKSSFHGRNIAMQNRRGTKTSSKNKITRG
ncbi:pentatricopeptide repeat-containing protein At1g80880, mitochondrial-like [Coffea arabica]|uniref:Pentatricopeptide repeat-containing protein At1g80880, mitochondrial-like n=1 Tax=Coffea arabica TaxID=13443 RepID=A0A6P6X4H2_COFAR|nr:pentatricopeptide repeat-containing protein At1g80880, mitochondrial-like [Coffea arabica]